ncbi:MAG: Hsp70 family protein [Verrucomicrobiales bacterium]|nr:Hsp70 family protein [Verrucomicrobiales bacterium]
MSKPTFSIGIDLGTTNCALAFAPLASDSSDSEVLPVSQWDSAATVVESDTLPSFLYRPGADESGLLQGKAGGGDWVVGRFAREQTTANPGRVVLSAKSWLSTSGIDQNTKFLPWGSDQLAEKDKLSPVRASALLLNYLRSAWDDAFPDAKFDEQQITITVPASFDASAQRLTLQAARDAGYPGGVRLLEEPQAAFCRWLETNDATEAFRETLPELAERAQCILVVDVGGGTSDFSLFEVRMRKNRKLPEIKRVAVSEHILLGGDNIDLAMAHVVAEIQLEGSLSPDQWSHLIAQCRRIKEEALANPDRSESFKIAVPGKGSGLFDGTLTAELSPDDMQIILFEGFYPECEADEVPEKTAAGLREFGLPYAKDSAVTRHLAAFLNGRPRVDAVLFNGGSLKPEPIQERLRSVIGNWQDHLPAVLPNPEPDLAVARGASSYGWFLQNQSSRIEAGAARALFLEVQKEGGENSLVCILPKGTPQEEDVVIDDLNLSLQANQPVIFQLYSSTRLENVKAGEILPAAKSGQLHQLPPLETVAKSEGEDVIPVHLSAKVNAIGLLQLECVDTGDLENRWPLEFILSGSSQPASAGAVTDIGVSKPKLRAARKRMEKLFHAPLNPKDKLSNSRLTASLEKIFETPKQDWNAVLLRKLWETHVESLEWSYLSPDHEETWLSFAGFLLRPGYGVQFDEERIDQLWKPEETGYEFSSKRIDLARYILWRRVAGGLDRPRQESLASECLEKLQTQAKPSAEVVRLIGALERLGLEQKAVICDLLIQKGKALADAGGYSDPYWVSLMLLLNRAPVYGGPETVMPAEEVATAFAALRKLDWKAPELASLPPLFLRAARQVDNPSLDLPKKLRNDIVSKLRKSGVAPVKLAPVEKYLEVERSEQVSLLGETLPPGLVLK